MNVTEIPKSFQLKDSLDSLPKQVCFITPPSDFLLLQRTFPNLGILKVAEVVRHAGIVVHHLDLTGIENYTDVVVDFIKNFPEITVFGLTSTTPQLPAATKIATAVRCYQKKAKIILGGPHVTLTNAAYKRELGLGKLGRAKKEIEKLQDTYDTLVAGDGEVAIMHALQPSSSKIIDADDHKNKELFLSNEMLTNSPWPSRDLIDLASYNYYIEGIQATTIIAQLGCPFVCIFCGGRLSDSYRRIRMRDSKDIVNELTFLFETYGYKAFMFYDDELNVNKGMIPLMNEIYEAQKKLGVEWRLRGFIKSQLFTDEQAQAMYRAGFRWILVGFESGSEKILQIINKKADRSENNRCVEIARRNGLKVKALMSIGHPGESMETIQETKSWLVEASPDDFDVTVITCYLGTQLHDEAVPHAEIPAVWVYTSSTGEKLYQREIDFSVSGGNYKGKPGDYRCHVYTDFLTSEQIVKERDILENEVRNELAIPFNPSTASIVYEHSMGMGGFPSTILRSSVQV